MSMWRGSCGVYTREHTAVPTIAAVIRRPSTKARWRSARRQRRLIGGYS
jgi:hypothetical protein